MGARRSIDNPSPGNAMPDNIPRVTATPAALQVIERLKARHGAVFFYQSHGCCDGSTPMCFAPGEMGLSSTDLQFGEVGGVPFYAGRTQIDYMQGTQVMLDIGQGSLGTFSLEDADGLHFKASTRLWTDDEAAWLAAHPLPGL
jgi:uncharacterized protein (DUF779 family)